MRRRGIRRFFVGAILVGLSLMGSRLALAQAAPAAQPTAPAQAQTQEPPPAGQQPGEEVPIALHLENADLLQVIGIIAAELQINYAIDPDVKGTVNINTLGQLRRADLFPLLQTILKLNGAGIVQSGNLYRIVSLQKIARMPLSPLLNPDPASLPEDERIVMNVIALQYVAAVEMTKILTPFLSEGGHLYSHEPGNILILTDTSRSARRLLELVALFDTEVFANQRIRLYPVKNSRSVQLAEELQEIFAAYGLSETAAAIRFVPMERINSILVVSANPSVYEEVERWLEKLDQPQQESGIRTFVYKVENGKAEALATVVTQLLGLSFAQPGVAAGAPGQQAAAALQQQMAARPTSVGSEVSHIRVVPDIINNFIVVQATAQEYEQIRQTLRQLDIVPRQVMLEARVYEVDLTGALSVGVSAFLKQRSDAERKLLAESLAPSVRASVGTLIGKTRELMIFLEAAEHRTQARVISAPSILASDNMAASLVVGTQIPVLTSQALVGGTQVGGANLFTNTVQNVDTGVLLTITPRINSSGLVNLQIQQEVSAPLPPPADGIQSPSIQKRSVSTQVVVQDGETIALGGIIQESHTLSTSRIPLLGRIPIVGALFGNTSVSNQRTELILLLTPTVIRDGAEARSATAELRDKLQGLRKLMEAEEKKEAR
ncbi:MAG: type II secretion system secretin GspD [Acidobacteria bacterium]|nr:type II secretion system secretin GspD [Acidobacteriota bacterium]